mmetsp:Transcript_12335/g.33124  ORF Transcript_12335/g.33124 Transcript_12335/m.33124 type:complete len:249 (-) Transcript_12335:990-1736(-)
MGASGGSSGLKHIIQRSPGFASASGKSASQSAGSSPMGRTSAGRMRARRRNTCVSTSRRSLPLLPQKIACPLEPPKPNEDTWAWLWSCLEVTSSVAKKASKAWPSRWALSCRAWFVGKQFECITSRMHLTMPPIAAPPSKCPMLVFAVDNISGSVRVAFSCTRRTAPTSMGSPKEVPVPWHSQLDVSGGVILASLMALQIISSCEGPFGAVRLALRPSCPSEEARNTASRSSASPNFKRMPDVPSPLK